MLVNPISSLANPFTPAENQGPIAQTRTTQVFDDVLSAAQSMFNRTNALQQQADVAQLDFVMGRNDNFLTVILAQERAYSSMNFTVNVVSRAVQAYQEIMRMQV
ncbi:MAG: flagellar hook-basal body complex protein FliE [Defluviitaleaceae bacterium]|nr:flagellar hook-basal body complex protein FliE [Defluviitaleaceae bacterium]